MLTLLGGMEVNDRAVSLLEQYDIEVLSIRKGRGAYLCDTKEGCLIFKEYTENPAKIELQNHILESLGEKVDFTVETIKKTKENSLLTEDMEGKKYLLKSYFEGRECNMNDMEECKEAMRNLAKLHLSMCVKEKLPDYQPYTFSVQKEFDKHNRELKKVFRYLREKSQKSTFENTLLSSFEYFLNQALEIAGEWKDYYLESDTEYVKEQGFFCHGDYQYHNILKSGKNVAILNFEKCISDDPVRDICFFLRKLLEKNNWSVSMGKDLLDTYQIVRPLSARSYIELYYRLLYPEKFWKIVNYYFNSRKSWIPEKNREKLLVLTSQEKEKQLFLDAVFRSLS